MSRHLGPRVKALRAMGIDLPGLSRKSMEKRPTPPGQHGMKKSSARKSEYGKQLLEKQKLRLNYGVSERQLKRIVTEARRSKAPTGAKLVELLERRLDNVVFRAGFAPTIPAARQLITHRHMRLNGRTVNIPSIRVRNGDTVAPRERSQSHQAIVDGLQNPPLQRPDWLAFDDTRKEARVAHLPGESDVPFPVELQQVVEFYSR